MAAVRGRLTAPRSERARKASSSRATPASRAQLVGGALGQQAAEAQQAKPPAALGLVHHVAGDDDGDPLPGHLGEALPELGPQLGVHADGGLVEEEQARPVDQSAGQGDPLPHPPAQGRHHRPPPREEVDQLQRLGDLRPRSASLKTVDGGEEADVLLHAEVGVEGRGLGHVADLGQHGAVRQAPAQHLDAAPVGRDQPHQGADQGGLARAVGPQQAVDLPGAGRSAMRRRGPAPGRRTWPAPRRARRCRWRSRPRLRGHRPQPGCRPARRPPPRAGRRAPGRDPWRRG